MTGCRVHGWRPIQSHGLCAECVDELARLTLVLLAHSPTLRRNLRRALSLRATVSDEALRRAVMESTI